ncbi:hypothetical protein BGZ54_006519 [Gamsiella multidivaricata]|nr:hypothetical protein BGZ54_006519 [Gamsiella multidivaricata]
MVQEEQNRNVEDLKKDMAALNDQLVQLAVSVNKVAALQDQLKERQTSFEAKFSEVKEAEERRFAELKEFLLTNLTEPGKHVSSST